MVLINITDAPTHIGGWKKAIDAKTVLRLINREELTEIMVKCSLDDNDHGMIRANEI